MKRPVLKLSLFVGIVGLVFIGFLVWLSRLQWIPAGHVGVVYNAQSGLRKTVYKPQALFIGFFDQLYVYPTKLQSAVYSNEKGYGEQSEADAIEITTSDAATTLFDISVFYRVQADDVFTVFDTFGPIPIEQIQTLHIRRAVREAVSAVGNKYDVFELLGPKRQEASIDLTNNLRARLKGRGITIVQAMIGTAYPSQSIVEKINQRVNAYTQLEISRLESQIAEISRRSAIITAQAETESRQITGSQTVAKSIEMLELELEAEAIDKWAKAGGKLPPIVVAPGQTIIVNGSGQPAIVNGDQR